MALVDRNCDFVINFTSILGPVFPCSLRPSEATHSGYGLKGGREDFGVSSPIAGKMDGYKPSTHPRDGVGLGNPTTSPQSLVTTSPREGVGEGPRDGGSTKHGKQRRTIGVAPFRSQNFWCFGWVVRGRGSVLRAQSASVAFVNKGGSSCTSTPWSGRWATSNPEHKLGRRSSSLRQACK
jgi:hypothetical protein